MSRPALTTAVCLLCVMPITVVADDADDARQTFDAVYGSRVKKVRATRDREDDTALAKQLIDTARSTSNAPALVVVLCNEAHDLARLHEPAVAIEAMRLLADTSPDAQKTANENIIKLLSILTRTGEPDTRDAAVNEFIALHTKQGDAAFEANDLREATAAYRQALVLASRQRHPSVDALRDKIKTAADRGRTLRQVEKLEETLLRDANDQSALEALVLTYLLDFQQPKKAASFVPRVKDAKLKASFQLAVQDAASLNADDSMKLGQWYIDLSNAESGSRAAVARFYGSEALKRFLLLHTANDINKTKAQLLLKDLESKMAKDAAGGIGLTRRSSTPSTLFKPPTGVKLAIHLSLDEGGAAPTFKDGADRNTTRKWNVTGTRSVRGKQGNARWFNGEGDVIHLPIKEVPAFNRKRLTVAMWVKPETADGVIFAVGGKTRGVAVYLTEGRLKYSTRIAARMSSVVTDELVPNRWFYLAVDVQADGTVTLVIDGKVVAKGKTPHALVEMPGQPMCLGSDNNAPGSDPNFRHVGTYNGKVHFKGTIDEFQMWVGE